MSLPHTTTITTTTTTTTPTPTTHRGEEVILDLGLNLLQALSLSQALITQEHHTEDGVPQHLIDAHLVGTVIHPSINYL